MWHFGHDSLDEYTSKEFEVAWEDGQNALMRIYTKDLNGVTRIRKERQSTLIKDSMIQEMKTTYCHQDARAND